MCLAVPMRLVSREGDVGVVELEGVQRTISLALLSDANIGDRLLIHAGYAIASVDEEEAEETLRLLRELAEAEGGEGEQG